MHAVSNSTGPGSTIPATASKRFCLILVKPSHYDDEGYVIQWFRSTIPSNSLAADPEKLEYMDLAMTPVIEDEDLEMFHTPSAPAFLAQEQRRQQATAERREPAAAA